MLGNEDFQLIELAKKVLFQLDNETRAAPTAEVQHGHDDNPIKVEAAAALPDSLQREIALQRGSAVEPLQQPKLQALEHIIRDRPAGVVAQRQIKVVPASRSRHGSGPPCDRRGKAQFQKGVSCGGAAEAGCRSPRKWAEAQRK